MASSKLRESVYPEAADSVTCMYLVVLAVVMFAAALLPNEVVRKVLFPELAAVPGPMVSVLALSRCEFHMDPFPVAARLVAVPALLPVVSHPAMVGPAAGVAVVVAVIVL